MKRRTVVRAIAGSAVGGSALASGVSGQESNEEPSHTHLQSEYDTVKSALSALREHAGDLLTELDDDGLIDTATVSEFDAARDSSDSLSDNEYIRVMSTVDDTTQTPTAVIRVTEEFSTGETSVFALPEAGRSYATVEYASGEKLLKSVDQHDAKKDGEVTPECDFHQYHQYDSYQGTTTDCSSEVCNSGRDECASQFIGCEWEHYIRETYEIYECTQLDYCPGGTVECSATASELVTTVCTQECCSDEGLGCRCDNYGCP